MEPINIPFYGKIAIYGVSLGIISYMYSKFKFRNVNLVKSFEGFFILSDNEKKGQILDKLFDIKGNAYIQLSPSEHLTSKVGLGDNLRNKSKSHRLYLRTTGLYFEGNGQTLWSYIVPSDSTGELVLYLDPIDDKLKLYHRTSFYDSSIGKWEFVKTIVDEQIDKFIITDDGDLIGVYNEKEIWKNGIPIVDTILDCEDDDLPEDVKYNEKPPIIPESNSLPQNLNDNLNDSFDELTNPIDIIYDDFNKGLKNL